MGSKSINQQIIFESNSMQPLFPTFLNSIVVNHFDLFSVTMSGFMLQMHY